MNWRWHYYGAIAVLIVLVVANEHWYIQPALYASLVAYCGFEAGYVRGRMRAKDDQQQTLRKARLLS